jgi:hypothetical protein
MMYSAHDTQIANILVALAPNYNFTYVPFASSIVFEVHRSTDNDAYINVVFNGEDLPIADCKNVQYHGCRVEDFFHSIGPRFIIADDERLREKCMAEPVWPDDFIDDGDPGILPQSISNFLE